MKFSVPGKTFILGEYAILGGLPAIVAAVPPRFSLESAPSARSAFHPESPAGRLLAGTPFTDDFPYVFHDPLSGAGGFGASTAQFALCYQAFARELGWSLDWRDVWQKYREVSTGSGADLMTQWLGGIRRCRVSPIEDGEGIPSAEPLAAQCAIWPNLMIFSASHQAGRKTATHHHLAGTLSAPDFGAVVEELRAPLDAGFAAVERGDLANFGRSMNQYAEVLRKSGLEIEPTRADCEVLGRIPGVLGVKGTGANQSDAIIVLADSDSGCKERITAAARARDLKLVSGGLAPENGISHRHD